MKYFNFKFLLFFAALALAIPQARAVTDVITASDLPATSTTATTFTGLSKTSGAIYAGKTAKTSKGAIIISKAENNYGIVSTTSGGKVKSVTIVFNENTERRTIQVYGKNTAYSSSNDLSDASAKGTLIGTTNNAANSITVSGDYEYIGLTSAYNNNYIDEIQIEWEGADVIPTITVDPAEVNITDATGDIKSASLTASVSPAATINANVTGDWAWNNNTATYNGKALHATGSATFSADGAEDAIEKLKSYGYVDDSRFALRYAQELQRLKKYGKRRIEQELYRKGIDREIIRDTLDGLTYDEETLPALIERKYSRQLDTEQGVKKTVAALQRLGYSYGEIRDALQRVQEDV